MVDAAERALRGEVLLLIDGLTWAWTFACNTVPFSHYMPPSSRPGPVQLRTLTAPHPLLAQFTMSSFNYTHEDARRTTIMSMAQGDGAVAAGAFYNSSTAPLVGARAWSACQGGPAVGQHPAMASMPSSLPAIPMPVWHIYA